METFTSTATIQIEIYNKLRDDSLTLDHMREKRIVITDYLWRGNIKTVFENRDEAFAELTKRLYDAEHELQMTKEALENEVAKKKRFWQ